MKPTHRLPRPALAGIASLGLATALLAPATHASASAADRPDSFTGAYSALLVPTEPADEAPVGVATPAAAVPDGESAPVIEQVSGQAVLWVNADQEVACFEIGLTGVTGGGPASVHLHEAAGAQLLALPGPSGCQPLSASILAQIAENPNAFYIEVHTDQSPDGAARGFLTPVPVGGVDAGRGLAPEGAALPVAGTAAVALLGLGGAVALSRRSRGSA